MDSKSLLQSAGSRIQPPRVSHMRIRKRMCVCVHARLLTQSCPTHCDPINCSPSGSSVHGIFQARTWSGLPFPQVYIYIRGRGTGTTLKINYTSKKKKNKNKQKKSFKGAESQGRIEYHYFTHTKGGPLWGHHSGVFPLVSSSPDQTVLLPDLPKKIHSASMT